MVVQIVTDLRSRFGPARDQGPRPTCLAFATSDLHAAVRSPAWDPLCCEYVFYHAQKRDGRSPNSGATFSGMLTAIRLDGQPLENHWPYALALPSDLSKWKPPVSQPAVYKRDSTIHGSQMDEITAAIDAGEPLLVTMKLSAAFFKPDPSGVIVAPASEFPDPALRHAVVLVAHGTEAGERTVLARNSWGSRWGKNGYAWMRESYVVPRLLRIARLTDEI